MINNKMSRGHDHRSRQARKLQSKAKRFALLAIVGGTTGLVYILWFLMRLVVVYAYKVLQ
jgi:hypothetical protein